MATAVANRVLEAIEAFENAAVDASLQRKITEFANAQAVLPRATLPLDETVGSPLIKLLIDNHENFVKTLGCAHVLYAVSSTGKTTALNYFVTVLLRNLGAPALMMSRMGDVPNYLDTIATLLQVREGNAQASWLATLVSALMPKPEVRLRHAPVLIFDEFNSLGPNNENLYFADSFSRFIYGKGITVLFVTQNEEVAKALCGLNRWQKVGPLPHATLPDRTTVTREEQPPLEYNWKSMGWTQRQLTQLILKRHRFKSKFDDEVDDNDNSCLPWLAGISTPTAAIYEAFRQVQRIEPTEKYQVPPDLLLSNGDGD